MVLLGSMTRVPPHAQQFPDPLHVLHVFAPSRLHFLPDPPQDAHRPLPHEQRRGELASLSQNAASRDAAHLGQRPGESPRRESPKRSIGTHSPHA